MKRMNQTWFFAFASMLMFLQLVSAQRFDYPTANLSTTWINRDSALDSYQDGSQASSILVSQSADPSYACGFYCNGACETFVFAIFIRGYTVFRQVVWSANRNNPVKLNATLQLTSEGDLVLRDVDGTLAWSTNTSNKSVAGLNLTEIGNLVLFDVNNSVVWQSFDYPTANLSTTWINSESALNSYTDGSKVSSILLSESIDPSYACGFYSDGTFDTFLFAIFIRGYTEFPQVVWSANRNNPVKLNATLQLTSEGDLVLRDVDGTLAWTTNTSHKSVVGLNLTETGNLVLFDVSNSVVWQSFDHPTDTLVLGQRLVSGQKLISSISDTNWTQGLFSLLVTNEGLIAFIESNPPQVYIEIIHRGMETKREGSYVKFQNGSLDFFILSAEPSDPDRSIPIPQASSAQFMRLRPDGHLKVYGYDLQTGWKEVADIFTGYVGECNYPMVCGKNGICSKGQCSCPRSITDSTIYFRKISSRQPDLGCSAVTPLTCNAPRCHSFVELEDVTYFTFSYDIINTDIDSCREACLRNCSCKAALFRYYLDPSRGDCYLPTEIFSLMDNEKDKTGSNASAFIKVQITPRKNGKRPVILGTAIGSFFLLVIIIGATVSILRKKKNAGEDEEDYLDHVPGMPSRFSHEELKIATEDFSKKLGEGGFGSVFEGVLIDGTKIAVKRLDGIGQVKKSFLAEVESIGSIHHVNLVRLIGFCAEKSHRLLVYEHMTNASLDRWIYHRSQDVILDWKCRRKIIQDVAKGLAYLHEECRQKILHLDIKPQNILLDEHYNAKLSDFGLSKLIGRDQSQVVTTMRGTPGYLAPEWLRGVITEKVDVYSFGVVVLEILCGRKNFELSEPEEYRHLLSLFKMKAEERRLFDLIDKRSEDMQSHGTEVMEMMQVAAWCLQSDHAKRPSMSVVVKVLEGVMDVEKNLDYSSLNSQTSSQNASENCYPDATLLLPSVLSGPR